MAEVQARILQLEAPARGASSPPADPPGSTTEIIAAWEKDPLERSTEEVALVFEAAVEGQADRRQSAGRGPRTRGREGASTECARSSSIASKKAKPSPPSDGQGDRRGRPRCPADFPPPPRATFTPKAPRSGPVPGRARLERARDPAAASVLGSEGQPRRLADPPRPPADDPGRRQPALAAALRPGARRHSQRLRPDGRAPQPPRVARPPGPGTGRARLEPEGDPSLDRHERDLSPVVPHARSRGHGRPRQPPALASCSPEARWRGDPRRLAQRLGPPRTARSAALASSPNCPPN